MSNSPHWLIVALVSATIGFCIPYVLKIIYYLFLHLKKNYLEGIWYCYHWTYLNNQPILIKSDWTIKKGVLHRFIVEMKQRDTGLVYTGKIIIEGDHLLIMLDSEQYIEHPVFRFPYPIPSNCKLLYGLWLSFDHDKKIASGGATLSRDELANDQVETVMKSGLKTEKNIILVRVK